MKQAAKPRILLCWGYFRQGWIAPYEALKSDFEFVYLYHKEPSEEDKVLTDCDRVYWNDYKDGFDVIDKVKPSKVIFMSLVSGYSIGLNNACRKLGVSTIILQHGFEHNYAFYRMLEGIRRDQGTNFNVKEKSDGGGKKFLLGSFRKNPWKLPVVILFLLIKPKKGIYYACEKFFFKARVPDFFILLARRNALLQREIFGANDANSHYIGYPEFDPLFNGSYLKKDEKNESDYMLLIDQPFSQSQFFDFGVTTEDMEGFHSKLNEYCLQKNLKLVIKLHPETYDADWLLNHENVDYIEDGNVIDLVDGSVGCFGCFSTLLLPAMYLKKCCVFYLGNLTSVQQEKWAEMGIAQLLDFHKFKVSDINIEEITRDENVMTEYINQYLHMADGQACMRLKALLVRKL